MMGDDLWLMWRAPRFLVNRKVFGLLGTVWTNEKRWVRCRKLVMRVAVNLARNSRMVRISSYPLNPTYKSYQFDYARVPGGGAKQSAPQCVCVGVAVLRFCWGWEDCLNYDLCD